MPATGELRLRGMFGTGFVTFHWQDDGSTDEELLETMRMSVLDLDEVKNILEMKIREYKQQSMSFECMKTLCNNFNKIIDTLLSLWRGTHRLHELHQFPSVNFLEHVMERCYKNCARKSFQVFDKKAFLIIDAVFKHFQLTEDDVLTEISSGSGSVVLQVSANSSFKCCYGILPETDSTSESENIAAEFTKWMEFYGKDYTEFQLYHEDLVSDEMLKLISDSTVIFLKDLNMGSEMENKISLVFSQLNESSRIISFVNCSQLFAFRDRTVDVTECTTGRSDVKYFLHVVKTRSLEDTDSKLESQFLSLTEVQKTEQQPLTPSSSSSPLSTSSTQTEFKAPGITEDVHKVLLPSSEAPPALIASLDSILSCYRNQFIKFIEFMQTKEYRLQLGEAMKEELLHKTELKNKIQSLLLQINELDGSSSMATVHRQHGIGSNSDGDVLAEVRTVVTYNRQLKILETLLKNEICQLEQKKPVQDDLLGLNHKGLLRKAGDCYKKYIQLKEKVKTLEEEVASLEGKTENSTILDRQGSTFGSSADNSTVKSIIPTEDVFRQFPVECMADASGTRPTSSSSSSTPKKRSHSEQHSGVVPSSNNNNFQCPKDVDTSFYRPDLRLHCPSTLSGDSLRVLFGSNGRMEGLMSLNSGHDHCSDLSGIGSHGLANRRGSSSSTDTADSGQGPKYGAQNVEGSSISSWPNSPESFQPSVSRFPGHISKSQQVLRSAMEHCKPLVESVNVRVPHAFSVMQSQSEGMTIPEVVLPVTGRGKPGSGKRGRRKRAASDAVDDDKSKPHSFLGKRGKLSPLVRTDTDTGWRLFTAEERDIEMKQEALLKGCDLALGFRQGIQHAEERGYAKPFKSNGTRTTKSDVQKAQDAGNLDALLLAVSLHHLPPSHRNLGQDLAPLTTKMLKEPLMHGAEHFSSASFLPLQLSSSSIMRAAGKLPFTTMSWSLPQVSESKPCVTMQGEISKEMPVHHPTYDKQMETVDDSHGKHFKKRCHSTNFKHYKAKKIGETAADSPNPINETTTTMPILKSLFSKRNDNLAPIVEGDEVGVNKRPTHLPTEPHITTGQNSSTKISSEGLTTVTTGVSQTSNVVFPKSEVSRYMSVPCPPAPPPPPLNKQLQGLSWFSLPLSLVRQIQMPQSDMSSAAERQLSESADKLLSEGASAYTSVSDHRTVTSSSVTSNLSASCVTVGPRRDRHRAVTKSSSR